MKALSALLAAALAGAVSAGAAAAQTGPDPETVVERADRSLDDLSTLRAEFVQRVENPILEKTEIGHGTLSYLAPDRFRIAYRYPEGDVVVHDGRFVWIFLPSSQPDQVIRQPAEASGVRNPMTYLRDLRRGYAVEHAGVEDVGGGSADHLVLTPESEDVAFTRIDVWVDRRTGLLRQVRTRTPDDLVTTYTFQTLEPGADLENGLFRFTPPEGVEVFDS